MRIAILEVAARKGVCVNKDINGGLGTVTRIGASWRARTLEHWKKTGIQLPLLSLGYAAAIFRKAGHDVEVVQDRVPERADLVLLNGSAVDFRSELEWARRVRAAATGKLGFIGPFVSAMPEIFLPEADFVIVGEAESALQEIAASGRIPQGRVDSPFVEDLDSLPFPSWDGFPIERYSYFPAIRRTPFLTIQSSRGCTFPCKRYCPYPAAQGDRWRDRSVRNVLDELSYLVERHGVRGFLFRDPLFSFNRERVRAIAEGILERKLDLEWACETRLDLLDEDLLRTFHRAGLRALNAGIESEDEAVLRGAKRPPVRRSHQEKILGFCDRIGVKVTAFFILGLPNDTRETVDRTIEYACRLNTHLAQFTISTPLPGTPFFHESRPTFLTEDWEQFNNYTPVFRHANLSSDDLLELKEKAFVSYYWRPRWLLSYVRRMARG
jgi:radical SAM superfamily enzyme YgiQ (UPF0313 family)